MKSTFTLYFFLIFCTSLTLAKSLRNTKPEEKCSKIICPPKPATTCVKVKEANSERRYVMMSKCELKIIKCHRDVKTTVVPAKFCNSLNALRQGDMEPVNDSGVADQDPAGQNEAINDQDAEGLSDEEVAGQDEAVNDPDAKGVSDEEVAEQDEAVNDPDAEGVADEAAEGKDEAVNDPNAEGVADEAAKGKDEAINDPDAEGVTDEEVAEQDKAVNDPDSAGVLDKEVVDQDKPVNDPDSEGVGDEEVAEQDKAVNDPDTAEVTHEEDSIAQNSQGEISKEHNVIEGDDDNGDQQEHEEQSGASCPETCPMRYVMVCARCPHGVYRTFMSACYMRMYQCKHPNEKLELVSRHACTGSAPYLGEMPKPKSMQVEPSDGDPVLQHILDLHKPE